MRTSKEEQRRILNMDIREFIEENIQDRGTKTRLVNGLWKNTVSPVAQVKDLWLTRGGSISHPLRRFRCVGRKCEIEFESALEKYDLYFGQPIDKIMVEEDKNKANKIMKVVIFDSREDKVYTFDNWTIPLPLVGDKVATPYSVKVDAIELSLCDIWIVNERVFNGEENTVALYCELQ